MLWLTIIIALFNILTNAIQVAPTWTTNSYVKADQFNVIDTLTGSSSTPTATHSFSNPFTAIPYLAFGISKYEGVDGLGQQLFEVNRTALTTTQFSVVIQIYGITNFLKLTVTYIAIEPSFPHQIVSFDNLPVNYSNGPLVNITVSSTTITYYVNTINFTNQALAVSSTYNKFSGSLSDHKILMFMTSLFIRGIADNYLTIPNPVDLNINAQVINNLSYVINASLSIKCYIEKLHFSMIIFNQFDILSSNRYVFIYQRYNLATNGGTYPFPAEFQTNFMVGFTDFSSPKTMSCISFHISLQYTNGTYGAFMPTSTISSAFNNMGILSRFGYTVLYMKTWLCPNNTYFNYSSNLCESCSISGCLTCQTLNLCLICDEAANYFLKQNNLCQFCIIPFCISCSNLTTCITCDNTSNYFINPSPTSVNDQCLSTVVICGDDILSAIQLCDDGNLLPNDGCSSECLIQTDFTCKPNSVVGKFNSLCLYVGKIQLQMLYIQKYDLSNELEIVVKINSTNMAFWDNVDFTSMVSLSIMTGFDSYIVKRNMDGTVSIIAKYNTDIHSMNITVKFDPKKSGLQALSNYTNLFKQFMVIPTDNQAAVFYAQNVYSLAYVISSLSYFIASASLLLFIVGIFAGKLIGVQLMAVVQISYLSLITLTQMNPCFKALSNIWFVNGFNYFHASQKYMLDVSMPVQFKGISLFARFAENYNFTVIIIILPYLFSLIFFILSKTLYKSNKQKALKMLTLAKRCACQVVFNGIMFSGYIIAVSLALQFLYGLAKEKDILGIISILQFVILTLVYLVYFIILAVFPQSFGQFVSCFQTSQKQYTQQMKNTQVKQNTSTKVCCKNNLRAKWYHLMMVQRILVGMTLVFMASLELSNLVPIVIFLILGVIVMVWRPYEMLANNIRFSCNMLVNIIIQAIFLSYKVTEPNDSNKQTWLFLPLVVCILLIFCIIYNCVMFVYEIVNSCKAQDKGELQRQQSQMHKRMWQQMNTVNSPKNSLITNQRIISGQDKQLDKNIREHLNQVGQFRKQLRRNLGIDSKNIIQSEFRYIENILSQAEYIL